MWLFNFVKFAFFSFLALLIYNYSQLYFSNLYGGKLSYKLWGIQRYGFERTSKLPKSFFGFTIKQIPLGIILPILVAILSGGGLFFVGVLSSVLLIDPLYRLGRLHTHLNDFEQAKIALSGPMSNILLAILIKFLEIKSLDNMILVCSMISISYMFPLPGLDGLKVFFGSRLLYIFSIVFILTAAFFLNFVSGLSALLLALLFGLAALINYFIKQNS